MRHQRHMHGSLHKGTMAGSLRGVHHSGMKGRIRHKSATLRPHKSRRGRRK